MNITNVDVTDNTVAVLEDELSGVTAAGEKRKSFNHNEEYGTAWYLKSREYHKTKRKVKRDTIKRCEEYGKVFD